MDGMGFEVGRVAPPLGERAIGELLTWWREVFEIEFDWLVGSLAGEDREYDEMGLYLVREGEAIQATCRLLQSRADRRLGLLGEVAVAPAARGHGLARRVCAAARDDLYEHGGEALFLATSRPNARRLYTQLGWRRLANSNAMVAVRDGGTPERFMLEYFANPDGLPVTIVPGGGQHRLTMIPVILCPHDWVVLDDNVGLWSLRHAAQPSCEGLYDKYRNAAEPGGWFAVERSDGIVVGLASARQTGEGQCCVEAFAHGDYQADCLEALYEAVVDWARGRGCKEMYTTCDRSDPLKEAALGELGCMRQVGVREPREL